jgi:hypothetical protein
MLPRRCATQNQTMKRIFAVKKFPNHALHPFIPHMPAYKK